VGETARYPFDFLVLAPGTTVDWRGHDAWSHLALACKSGRDALEAYHAVEDAVACARDLDDEVARRRALTFVVAGGGPTGVEAMAHLVSRMQLDVRPALPPRLADEIRLVLVEPQ